MKLNSKNFDHDTLDIVSSKLSSKMETSMAIIGNSPEDSFAIKLYYVLKSEYSIYFSIAQNNNYKFPVVNIEDGEILKAFFIYNKISTVLVTSEIILAYLRQANTQALTQAFRNFVTLCSELSIKIVFVGLKNLHFKSDHSYIIYGAKHDEYFRILQSLTEEVLSVKKNLVVLLPFVYGLNELIAEPSFTECIASMDNNNVFLKGYGDVILQPVLNDEAARFIGKNLTRTGKIEPGDIEEKTVSQWVEELRNREHHASRSNTIDTDEYNLNQKEFCCTQRGEEIIQRQKKCAFNLIYKFSPLEEFCGRRVAEVRVELGKRLCGELDSSILQDADFISPVPQTGLYYAMGLAQKSGIAYLQALIKDSNAMRSFQVLDANVRKEIIKKKIFPIQELIEGKNLIVVDEAIFTGTTLKIVCKVLRECGAKKIHLAIPTPKCYQQCPYYSQPSRTMLLEYVRASALSEYFDVDSVTFQSMEGFEAELNKIGECCSYCFSKSEVRR